MSSLLFSEGFRDSGSFVIFSRPQDDNNIGSHYFKYRPAKIYTDSAFLANFLVAIIFILLKGTVELKHYYLNLFCIIWIVQLALDYLLPWN